MSYRRVTRSALAYMNFDIVIENHDMTNDEILSEICSHIYEHPQEYFDWMVEEGYDPDGDDPEAHPYRLSVWSNWKLVEEGDAYTPLQWNNFVLEARVYGDTEKKVTVDFEID